MTLIERMFQNGQISNEEMSKLSEVRSGLINALECGQLRTIEFVRKTFYGNSPESITKLSSMVEKVATEVEKNVIDQYGADVCLAIEFLLDESMLKNAGAPSFSHGLQSARRVISGSPHLGPILKKLEGPAYAAILAGLGLSILHSAGQGLSMITSPVKNLITKYQTKKESERIFAEVLEENPELKKEPKIMEYFRSLQKYVPRTVATNKPVVESLLKKMHQWGQLDPQTMSQLIQMEGTYIGGVLGRSYKHPEGGRSMSPMEMADLATPPQEVMP